MPKKAKAAKKNSAKKIPTKKPAKKAALKPIKKIAAKKSPAKKAVKIIKKPIKAEKKSVKKLEKKPASKKVLKNTKPEKILPSKKEEIQPKKSDQKSLAKTILAKHSIKKNKAEKEAEAVKAEATKKEAMQKGIIVRRSDGRSKVSFKIGDYAVYPSHGIGKIVDIEKTNILNQEFKCYLMSFEKERLTIKIPMNSAEKIGLRPLISKDEMSEVFVILRSGVKKLKGMWSRRAQEYETKINSGDIILLAEVLRDLTRDIEDSERSYSERIIYETAIYRLAGEYSVIYAIPFEEAKEKIITIAKDKLGSETRAAGKDEFDEFDIDDKSSDPEDDEENEDEEEEEDEDEDDDFDYDDEDDDGPKKKKRKK